MGNNKFFLPLFENKSFAQNFQHSILTTKQFINNMSEGWRNTDWSHFLKILFPPHRVGIIFYSLIMLHVSSSIHSCSKMHSYHPKCYSWLPTYACHTSVFSFSIPTPGFHFSFSMHWFLKISSTTNEPPCLPSSHFQMIMHTWRLFHVIVPLCLPGNFSKLFAKIPTS